MRDLCDYAAHRRCILTLDRLIELGYAKAPNDILLLLGITNGTAIVLYLDIPGAFVFLLLCHYFIGFGAAGT